MQFCLFFVCVIADLFFCRRYMRSEWWQEMWGLYKSWWGKIPFLWRKMQFHLVNNPEEVLGIFLWIHNYRLFSGPWQIWISKYMFPVDDTLWLLMVLDFYVWWWINTCISERPFLKASQCNFTFFLDFWHDWKV